jgi:tetrahydromethanopterin S-methyltransferase subunit G
MDNTVIKVLDKEHGKKVIEFFKAHGVDTGEYAGTVINMYYGVINGIFFYYNTELPPHVKIIELPTERTFPRVMYVSDYDDITNESKKRVVLMKKCGVYIAWNNAETIEDSESRTGVTTWRFAKEVDEVEKTIELTHAEAIRLLEEKLGQTVKII